MELHSDPLAATEAGDPSDESLADAPGAHGSIPDVTAGRSLGRYVVIDTLGRGAMGTVLRAYDPSLDRAVALKLLHPGAAQRQARRLNREAQALAKLSHPHVVQVYEVGKQGEHWFIAMELVQGQTLRQWAEPERSWRECVAVYLQAGEGLEAAHEVGLVHRDFKPDNCIIDDRGRVRVLDFGLVREQQLPSSGALVDPTVQGTANDLAMGDTQAGAVVGTPAYMPLEQFEGKVADERSDQFSFCVALYEALYGERPYEGDTIGRLVLSLTTEEVRVPRIARGAPPRLRRALERGLSRDPEARWPSMRDLLGELRRTVAPRRRSRAAVVLGAGLLVLGAGLVMSTDEPPCQGARGQLAGIWDQARRQQVGRSILGTQAPFAADTWARVEPALDAYAEAWAAKHTEVCEATSVYQEQSAEVMDLRMGCLERRRAALRETVQLLADANVNRVERAVELVASLHRPQACDDLDALRAGVPPPKDAAVAARVEELRADLDRARSLRLAGEYAEGLAVVDAVAVEQEAIDYAPLRAEALSLRGQLRQHLARYPEAEQDLQRAYIVGTECGHDAPAASAVAALTELVGDTLARHEHGLWWGQTALALARRLRSPSQEAEALSSVGDVLEERGEYDRALERHREALALWAKVDGGRGLQSANAMHDIANMLWRKGDYDHALPQLEEVRVLYVEQLGSGHPQLAAVESSMGNVRLDQGRYDQALEHYRRSLAIREHALGPEHPKVADSLFNLAAVLQSRGQGDEALSLTRRALAIREESLGPEHPDVASALEGIAVILRSREQLTEAQAHQERALAIRERVLGPEHPEIATSLLNLGSMLSAQERTKEALEHYQRALAIRERALGPTHPKLVTVLNNIGVVLINLERLDEALAAYRRALAIGEASLGSHPSVAALLRGIGDINYYKGDIRGAFDLYLRSHDMFEEALGPDHHRVAFMQWWLATTALELGDLDQAHRYALRSRATYARLGGHQDELAEIDDWLRRNPPADAPPPPAAPSPHEPSR